MYRNLLGYCSQTSTEKVSLVFFLYIDLRNIDARGKHLSVASCMPATGGGAHDQHVPTGNGTSNLLVHRTTPNRATLTRATHCL